MSVRRAFGLKFVLLLLLVCVGCGDTFRPVATPLIPPQPSPAAPHSILMLSTNGPNNRGTSSNFDVSGDTTSAVAPLGLGPIHAALTPNNLQFYVANSLEDSVSTFSPGGIGPVTTISLPLGSKPAFVHTTENGNVYVANFGSMSVAAISTTTNVITNPLIPVGNQPMALAETSDGAKLYAANSADDTVTSINTAALTPVATIPTDATPVWLLARPDAVQVQPVGFRVYVLNSGGGTLSTINTATDTTIPPNVPVGAGANFMVYDKTRTQLYVVNPTLPKVVVLNAATDPPTLVNPAIDLTQAPTGVPISTLASKVSVTAALQSGTNTTYTYTPISGPPLQGVGQGIVITGMGNAGNNGTFTISAIGTGAFTVVNPSGVTASGQTGTGVTGGPVSMTVLADGTRAYVVSYALVNDTTRNPPAEAIEWQVSVVNPQTNTVRSVVPADPASTLFDVDNVNPTGCGAKPFGPLSPLPFRLFIVAAADSSRVYVASCDSGRIEIISTASDTLISNPDGTAVLTLPAPPSVFLSPKLSITAASPNGAGTTYTYTALSGPPLQVGMDIVITGMADGGNNGTFAVTAVGAGTFTAANSSGVTATAQSGSGNVTTPPPQNPVFMLAGP